MRTKHHFIALATLLTALALLPVPARALTVDPFYAGDYTAVSLGSVPGLPSPYGGLTLLPSDSNTLLIGGSANAASGKLYTIGVTRDAQNHINGFSGTATFYSDGANNDGGLQFGPDGVLFYTRYSNNEIGQIKPGSSVTDKVVDLDVLGVGSSVGGLAFVPLGSPGAGQFKIVSYNTGQWYTATLASDGLGTYDITSVTENADLTGGPEGIAYVPAGSPLFPVASLLISEWSAGKVSTYEVDADGNPLVATRREFITDLTGAEGAFIDPVTGDFLFSTFGGGDQVIVVKGFVPPPIPVPSTLLLLGSGLAGLFGLGRKFRRT